VVREVADHSLNLTVTDFGTTWSFP
jgi:hypothetical protein